MKSLDSHSAWSNRFPLAMQQGQRDLGAQIVNLVALDKFIAHFWCAHAACRAFLVRQTAGYELIMS